MGDLRFRMTAPKALKLQFSQARRSSLPSSRSKTKARRDIRSSTLLRPIFTDLQLKPVTYDQDDDADESSQKQHRCRPPRGIQHWFEAFDEYLLTSDSDDDLSFESPEQSPRSQWRPSFPSPKKNFDTQSDLSKDDASAYSLHPLQANPTTDDNKSSPLLRASPAKLRSYFNISSPSLYASSVPRTADFATDRYFAPSVLQAENEDEIMLVDEARVQTYRLFPYSKTTRLPDPTTQCKPVGDREPDVTSEESSYLLPNYLSTDGKFMQDLFLPPVSPLNCRFSRVLSQIDVDSESVLLTRRQRRLRHLELDSATAAAE